MKIVSYNIQYGFGRDGKMDFDRIAEEIRGADIIALQEVTRHFFRNENADMVAIFENLFPDYFSAFGPACEVDAGSSVEAGKAVIRRFQFGNMVLSRFPILSVRNLLLPRTRCGSSDHDANRAIAGLFCASRPSSLRRTGRSGSISERPRAQLRP